MKKTLLLASAFFLCLTMACKKEVVEAPETPETPTAPTPTTPPTQPVTYASISAYFDGNPVVADNFTTSASTGGVYTTTRGSVLTIPPNAFIAQDGTPITGTVNVKVKEVFTNSDFIFSGIFPVCGSLVLNSGGEFFIEAKQNGNTLRVTDGELINFKIPAQAEDPQMQLFLGGPIEEDSVNWELADTVGTGGAISGFTFNSADDTYSINLDSLGWGNIDAFDWTITYFDCNFNLTGLTGLDNTNTTAFAVFEGQNSVWPVGTPGWGSITNNLITETHLADVPMNLLVISVVNSQLYYGLLNVTPVQNQTYNIPMTMTTAGDLDAIINGLE